MTTTRDGEAVLVAIIRTRLTCALRLDRPARLASDCRDFFQEMAPQIGPMFEAVGITEEPRPTFWRKLETHDDVGWEDR